MSKRKAKILSNQSLKSSGKTWMAITWMILLALSVVALSRWIIPLNPRRAGHEASAQLAQSRLKLSKEYIYAGGRLIATEEPIAAPLPVPTGLSATASVSTISAPSVTVVWTPVSGTIDHYEVERKVSLTDQSPYSFNCAATPCLDATALASRAYLYRVRAVFAGGSRSNYSNQDLAATFPFTDDPLNPNGVRTVIAASHFLELREAVNAVRISAGLLPFEWTGVPPQSRGVIYASHFNDLQKGLGEALAKLGLPTPEYPAAGKGSAVTAKTVQELRELMR